MLTLRTACQGSLFMGISSSSSTGKFSTRVPSDKPRVKPCLWPHWWCQCLRAKGGERHHHGDQKKKKWWLLRRTFQINCQESIRHFMEAEVFGYFVQRLYASQCNEHSRKYMDADSLHFRVLHRATSLVAKRFTDHTRSELKKFLRIFHDYNYF